MSGDSYQDAELLSHQLATLTQSADCGVFQLQVNSDATLNKHSDHTWAVINPSLLGLAGKTVPVDLLLLVLYELDSDAALEEMLAFLRAGNTQFERVVKSVREPDTPIYLKVKLNVTVGSAAEPVRIQGSIHNITGERQAEENLKTLGRRLNSILVEVPIGIFRVEVDEDDDDIATMARAKGSWMVHASMLYGLPDGTIKSPFEVTQYIVEEDRETVFHAFNRALANMEDTYEVEYRTVWPDGSLHWLCSRSIIERDREGHLSAVSGIQYEITDRKLQQQGLEYLASHDTLTGLPNRHHCLETLARMVSAGQRYKRAFAVMYIDLDGFKRVNDTLGHEAGDKLLQRFTGKLKKVLRASEFFARLGGDEFVVLVDGVRDEAQAEVVAGKILAVATSDQLIEDQESPVSASVGIARFPQDGHDANLLIKRADIAMYAAKDLGKNQHQFFKPELESAFKSKIQSLLANE